MANLKEIRDRIVSVKNTRKITEAMRLVAAAKVRRAQDQVLKSRPFADKLARVLENIQSRVQFEAVDSPLLSKREVKSITLVCICLLYTSPSPRDYAASRMPSSA